MKSMTGFGVASTDTNGVTLNVTIRAVNGRYFEWRPHIPRAYQSLEREMKKLFSKKVSRGTVDLYLRRQVQNASHVQINLNTDLAKKWKKAYEKLSQTVKLDLDLSSESLGALPDVMSLEEDLSVSSQEKKMVFKVLENALEEFEKERKREGAALKSELKKQLQSLNDLLKEVKVLSSDINKEQKKKLSDRLKSLDSQIELDPTRVAQEVALLLDKSDVREEISRLEEHLNLFKKLVNSSESIGKKMDFYCQELLREFNTIGSKSSLAKLTQTVVNAKSVIEKLREQVQNVE